VQIKFLKKKSNKVMQIKGDVKHKIVFFSFPIWHRVDMTSTV